MKAERRHELQTNSLALWLQIRLPEYWQKYGNHILLGLIIVIGAFWFVRWRIEAPKKAAAQAGQVLSAVDQNILELRRMQMVQEIGADKNTTTVVLMPSDMITLSGKLNEYLSRH